MHNKQTGRVIFILFIVLAALFGIFQQPQNLLRKDLSWSQKMMLKPGLDMVGGTSLLYQIKAPEGGFHPANGQTLAQEEMAALKRRVDPMGEKNYIWRPQGTDRLEIQIPASTKNVEAAKARDAEVDAQRALNQLAISRQEVIAAVEQPAGADRDKKLVELAKGIPTRAALFAQLTKAYDAKTAARAAQNVQAMAAASLEYDKLVDQVEMSNVRPSQLEPVLDQTGDQRKTHLDALKARYAGSAEGQKAIDQFAAAYDVYKPLKSSVDDAGQLKRDLQGSGVLEFHIAVSPGEMTNDQNRKMVTKLQTKGPRPEAGDDAAWYQLDRPEDYHGVSEPFDGKQYILCWTSPKKQMVNGPGMQRWAMEDAGITQSPTGGNAVSFQLDRAGGSLFHDFTTANLHKQLAAVLDRKVISVANINSVIDSSGEISGDYTAEDMDYMVTTLKAGSLPAQLEDEPISEHTVGPALGAENLQRGLRACVFGLVVVAAFLIFYYYLAGVVATFAVLMNVLLILGILSMFDATFTLPGVAGIVLTIGAAVDANVLIFERLREEQHLGLNLRVAMRNAYDHAQSAIFDSNATTVITSLILWWLGSEEVKGFGITLLIGLLSSLFTSLFVTRTIFNILIDTLHVKNLSSFPLTFPAWDRFLKPDINWMRMAPIFWVMSFVFIVSGVVAFVATARNHELADVDFTSGTQVQFDLRKPMSIEQVNAAFAKANDPAIPAANITEVGAENGQKGTSFELVTANADSKAVKASVLNILGSNIKADLPSKFDHFDSAVDGAIASGTVVPVTTGFTVNDVKVPAADDFIGGGAVVLKDLDPPLRQEEIRDRLDRMRATTNTETGAAALSSFSVWSPLGSGAPTNFAVVLTIDPDFPHDKDPGKWTTNVADPIWNLVKNGVNSGGQLQKVNTFGPQVAGDNQQSAFFALILSSLVIMGYIWFRFGNLKYGTATVLAMIHDVALVIGALGLSHYIVKIPWLANLLMVEPFRVNLTIVAAVLTVMSYSMIDTIVVFDRIRENRGKFGYLSKRIVNDSINQTLSRTLLTAGTTIVTVAGMYVVGGPGIHGFTFVLLVGILVGTYSSIAIAAPFLLIGADVRQESDRKGPKGPPTGQLQRVAAA